MGSILLVSPRQGAEIAHAEYQDVLRATKLSAAEIDHVLLDSPSAPLPNLDHYRGIIVGGSPLNVTNTAYDDWQCHVHHELGKLIELDKPVFFVCYGNAFVVDYFGGTIGRTHPETSGPTLVQLTAAGEQDPITKDLPASFTSLTGHTENVVRVPENITVLAQGPTCPIQMVRGNASTWACQFHAEMDAEGMHHRMDFYYDYGYFPIAEYDAIVAQLPSIDTTYSNKVLQNFVAYCLAEHTMSVHS